MLDKRVVVTTCLLLMISLVGAFRFSYKYDMLDWTGCGIGNWGRSRNLCPSCLMLYTTLVYWLKPMWTLIFCCHQHGMIVTWLCTANVYDDSGSSHAYNCYDSSRYVKSTSQVASRLQLWCDSPVMKYRARDTIINYENCLLLVLDVKWESVEMTGHIFLELFMDFW